MWQIIKFEMLSARILVLNSFVLSLIYYTGIPARWWGSDTGAGLIICTVWMLWATDLNKSKRFINYAILPVTPLKLGIIRVAVVFLFLMATFWVEPVHVLLRGAKSGTALMDMFQIVFYSFIVFGVIIAGDLRAVMPPAGRKGTAAAWGITASVLLVILVAVVLFEKHTIGRNNAMIQTCVAVSVEILLASASVIIFKSRKDYIR